MKEEEVKALFLLAGIQFSKIYRIENKYWPNNEHYAEIRRESPWWLVLTDHGVIEIGWRKRVISIDWEGTHVRESVTSDDVTKDTTYVHAWSMSKAVQYLDSLSNALRKPIGNICTIK